MRALARSLLPLAVFFAWIEGGGSAEPSPAGSGRKGFPGSPPQRNGTARPREGAGCGAGPAPQRSPLGACAGRPRAAPVPHGGRGVRGAPAPPGGASPPEGGERPRPRPSVPLPPCWGRAQPQPQPGPEGTVGCCRCRIPLAQPP